MNRRSFLQRSAVTGGLVSSGCAELDLRAIAPHQHLQPSEAEVAKILAEFDRQLGAVRRPEPKHPLLRAVAERDDAHRGHHLAVSAFESLLVTGNFRVQPIEVQVHPEMQGRMRTALPGIDRAATDMRNHLGSYTPTERADLTRRLRRDPKLFERIADALDEESASNGIDQMRRLHTRRIVAQAGARLSHSSELFIDELVHKVDKLREQDHSAEALERRLVARIGEAGLAELEARVRRSEEAWATEGPRIAQAHPGIIDPSAPPPPKPTSGVNGLLVAGGVLMGLTVMFGTIGGVIVASGEIAGAFLLTLGGVLFLVGLILLIVGAVRD